MARRDTRRLDEDDVRNRPTRYGSRARSKQRPAHTDAATGMVVTIDRGRFSLDRTKEIPSLRGLGASEARKALPRVRELFCQTRVEPFVPFQTPNTL